MSSEAENRGVDRALGESNAGNGTDSRIARVRAASLQWMAELEDLGGHNNLLHYRICGLGTLDLAVAVPEVVDALLRGTVVRLSALFGEPELFEDALSRARAIHRKAKENFEERGIGTVSIACGLASWENRRAGWEPLALCSCAAPR